MSLPIFRVIALWLIKLMNKRKGISPAHCFWITGISQKPNTERPQLYLFEFCLLLQLYGAQYEVFYFLVWAKYYVKLMQPLLISGFYIKHRGRCAWRTVMTQIPVTDRRSSPTYNMESDRLSGWYWGCTDVLCSLQRQSGQIIWRNLQQNICSVQQG